MTNLQLTYELQTIKFIFSYIWYFKCSDYHTKITREMHRKSTIPIECHISYFFKFTN